MLYFTGMQIAETSEGNAKIKFHHTSLTIFSAFILMQPVSALCRALKRHFQIARH